MKIAIAFATLSGNTEMVANELYKFLKPLAFSVDLLNLDVVKADRLKEYDFVFFGCSTYGDGDLNLIMDIFLEEAEHSCHDCQSTKFAVFSLGDSLYIDFAKAGEIVEEKLINMGARIVSKNIKIDGYPDDSVFYEVNNWALAVLKNK